MEKVVRKPNSSGNVRYPPGLWLAAGSEALPRAADTEAYGQQSRSSHRRRFRALSERSRSARRLLAREAAAGEEGGAAGPVRLGPRLGPRCRPGAVRRLRLRAARLDV